MNKVTFSHIVAVSLNGVIGKDNELPWHLPLDLNFFKEKTAHSIIIMGRKTFESIGRLLPHRFHIVISNKAKESFLSHERLRVVSSLEDAVELANELSKEWKKEVFIIGGAGVFASSLPLIDKIYLTRVYQTIEGDTFYPVAFLKEFSLENFELKKDGEITIAFNLYQRN
jgi:dihydrofolate reductase